MHERLIIEMLWLSQDGGICLIFLFKSFYECIIYVIKKSIKLFHYETLTFACQPRCTLLALSQLRRGSLASSPDVTGHE